MAQWDQDLELAEATLLRLGHFSPPTPHRGGGPGRVPSSRGNPPTPQGPLGVSGVLVFLCFSVSCASLFVMLLCSSVLLFMGFWFGRLGRVRLSSF